MRIFNTHQPSLLVCLDCGTNSNDAIAWLKQQSVDTLVVDHHPLEGNRPDAIAVVNPKAHGADADDCCAAGLTLLICHEIACAWNVENRWNRDTAIMLAGIGTVADAVAMTQHNRAIVKTALALLNDPSKVTQNHGLAALLANQRELNQRQLQFSIVPALNAPGRLGDSETVVTMLTTSNPNTAKNIAAYCREQNELRKKLQRAMVAQAQVLASVVVSEHPETPVLVLAEKSWHHGVAGPAASQIAEIYQRSAILLAPHGDQQWKGSGRSANGDNLGRWIRDMKCLGLVERGGGHACAVGLAATHAQLAPLQSAGLFLPVPQTDLEPEMELIGELDQLQPEEWATVTELMSPYGRNNPLPLLNASAMKCVSDPMALISKENDTPWAMKTTFRTNGGKTLTVTWRDVEAARKQWRAGARCDLELELSTQTKWEQTFVNWSVVSCRPSGEKRYNNPKRLAATGGFQPQPWHTWPFAGRNTHGPQMNGGSCEMV